MIIEHEVKRMEKKQMEYMQFKERLKEALQKYFLGSGEVYYGKVKKTKDSTFVGDPGCEAYTMAR